MMTEFLQIHLTRKNY